MSYPSSQPSSVASKTAQGASASEPGKSIPACSRTVLRRPSQPTTQDTSTSSCSPSRSSVANTPADTGRNPARRVERVTAPPCASKYSVRTDSVTSSEIPMSKL
jgi:hypothetical protein